MPITIRPAGATDLNDLASLLLAKAEARHRSNPGLWPLVPDMGDRIRATLTDHLLSTAPGLRHHWLIARHAGRPVGMAHAILLPVPPIYAGAFGPPGLMREDCHVISDAPPETGADLLHATESLLIGAGARLLLTASTGNGPANTPWDDACTARGYAPLTLYLARTGLADQSEVKAKTTDARPATPADVPAIVMASADHRRTLDRLNPPFWAPHPEADSRFAAWMTRSLTLPDRDMFVAGVSPDQAGAIRGYVISQPATALHAPVGHDCAGTGIIDDFHHAALADPDILAPDRDEAAALFRAAESARARRGDRSVLVVCPAAWRSKSALLEQLGYRTALTWSLRITD